MQANKGPIVRTALFPGASVRAVMVLFVAGHCLDWRGAYLFDAQGLSVDGKPCSLVLILQSRTLQEEMYL